MADALRPVWTNNVELTGISGGVASLALGARLRGTLDLTSKVGAFVSCKIGRGGLTAITTKGIDVKFYQVQNSGTAKAGGLYVPLAVAYQSGMTASNGGATAITTVDGSTAGQNELKLNAITNLAVDDVICIQDSGGGTTRMEFGRISKLTVGSGTGVTLDSPLTFTHTTAQADTVRNQAEVWPDTWLQGGSLYAVVFDYGGSGAGDTAYIACWARTYDYDQRITV